MFYSLFEELLTFSRKVAHRHHHETGTFVVVDFVHETDVQQELKNALVLTVVFDGDEVRRVDSAQVGSRNQDRGPIVCVQELDGLVAVAVEAADQLDAVSGIGGIVGEGGVAEHR